ncbi:rifin PIR protein, putative [Plasmodium reichenowi]|uniref:Rifin PIR protein, putative n=1 Tax=Plasmodium reichenowi TaxID=5854 RepID=A0A2P9DTH8_PLARE|nr:rifin PIR protein, putative [Plasmodium reichenowi]
MKLHYSKILLFFLTLNILVTSYHAHNKNKPSITPHDTQIYISRVLSEKDIESSIYDKDAEINSVKENFDRQTSQRFQEYEERMNEKRQKRKEEREKNIEEIIKKDKMDKSLADKIEKGCLKCGCGLGGVAASVGLFGGLGIYGWKSAALAAAKDAAAKAAGDAAGAAKVIDLIKSKFVVSTLNDQTLGSYITPNTYTDVSNIASFIDSHFRTSCLIHGAVSDEPICAFVEEQSKGAIHNSGISGWGFVSQTDVIQSHVNEIVTKAITHAVEVTKEATEEATTLITTEEIGVIDSISSSCQIAIIASVVALLIIVLVMVIIYLILRYRRKKKMKKKDQYTKLLNQ